MSTNQTNIKLIICILLIGCWSVPLFATHIIGSELSYRCLGGNQYEVRLDVYRDCDSGVPDFDNPGYIAVANQNWEVQRVVSLTLPDSMLSANNLPLEEPFPDSCFTAINEVCVQRAIYVDTIMLLPQIGGYKLVYQRCCRNRDVLNILNATETGATAYIEITQQALLTCNSSPRFERFPPYFVCVDRPFEYQYNGIDIDNNLLEYSICAPLDGPPITQDPQPSNPDDYILPPQELEFIDELGFSFSLERPFGNGSSLSIEPETGLMQGFPTLSGGFVFGVCITEYDDQGRILSRVLRDFEYIVGECENPSFSIPDLTCSDDLTVDFINDSDGGNSFFWDFGDPASGLDNTSNLFEPTHVFSDTGRYNVTLVTNPDKLCRDTFVEEIGVYRPDTAFSPLPNDTLLCFSPVFLSLDTLENGAFIWALDSTFDSQITEDPILNVAINSDTTFYYQIVTNTGCDTIRDSIRITQDIIDVEYDPFISPCLGDSILIVANVISVSPIIDQDWQTNIPVLNETQSSILIEPIVGDTVFLEVENSSCRITDTLEVEVLFPDSIYTELSKDTMSCEREMGLMLPFFNEARYLWFQNPSADPLLSTEQDITVQPPLYPGVDKYYYRIIDSTGCIDLLDSVNVQNQAVDIVSNDTTICLGDTAVLIAVSLTASPVNEYQWTPSNQIITGQGTNKTLTSPLDTVLFEIIASNDFCDDTSTSLVAVIPSRELTTTLPNQLTTCTNELTVSTTFYDYARYVWSTSSRFATILSRTNEVSLFVGRTDVLYLKVEEIEGCRTVLDSTILDNQTVDIEADDEALYCIDEPSITLTAQNNSPVQEDLFYDWSGPVPIVDGNGTNTVNIMNPRSGQYIVTGFSLRCEESDTIQVTVGSDIQAVVFAQATPDTIFAGQSSQLDVTQIPNVQYNWFPSISLNNSTIPDPVARPDVTTDYAVNISDRFGCERTATTRVNVNENRCLFPNVFIPNAFTPNGDGENDVFRVRGNSVASVDLIVVNRWGETVFESKGTISNGWDGTYKGAVLSPDVYGYYAEITCWDGQQTTAQGNVTLLK